MKTDKGTLDDQKQMEDGEEVLDRDNSSAVLVTVFYTINNKFEYKGLDEAVRMLNAHLIHKSIADRISGNKQQIPGLPGTKFLVHQVLAISFIVRRWVWDSDMPGALVADEMGLGKTFTSVAAAVISKLLTECKAICLFMASYGGIQIDMVANMDLNIVE